MFWFFGHPEVYVLILPSFGVINHVISSYVFTLYSKTSIVYCIILIGVVGMYVWAHHMYVVGLDTDTIAFFSVVTMIISLPTGCKVFNWFMTLISYSGQFNNIAILLVIYYVALFIVGGTTGVILGNTLIDVSCHDTFYVVIHFHIVLSLAIVVSIVIVIVTSYA